MPPTKKIQTNKNPDSNWIIRFVIFLAWAGILAAILAFGLVKFFGEWRNSEASANNAVYENLEKEKPTIKPVWVEINQDDKTYEISTTWSIVSKEYKAYIWLINMSGQIVEKIPFDDSIKDWKISIPQEDIPKDIKSITTTCEYLWQQRLANGDVPDCTISWLTDIPLDIPDYKDLNFLWVDATFADDNIKLTTARDFFENKDANFYSAYSVWKNKWEWALRIDSKRLFWKKMLFIFINEERIKKDSETYKKIISDLRWLYPHLDEVMIRSFEDISYALDSYNEANEVRYILWYIWDCNNTETWPCDNWTKYQRKFTKKLLKIYDIDVFFIVPATLDTALLN